MVMCYLHPYRTSTRTSALLLVKEHLHGSCVISKYLLINLQHVMINTHHYQREV